MPLGTAPLTVRHPEPFVDGDLYDALFADFRWDLDFYLGLAKESRGPVLEIGCGTGRVLIPCLEAGVDIDGIDLFAEMITVLERKAKERGLAPRVHQADMRNFTLARRYQLIFIPFNGFVHCLTSDDQIAALSRCREHLTPDGMLVFNVFAPRDGAPREPDGIPILEHEAPDPRTGLPVRIYDTRYRDTIRQVQHSLMEIQELDAGGAIARSHRFETDMRWTYKPELELLLRVAGFKSWDLYGGFDRGPLTPSSDTMVVFARNEARAR